MYNNKRGVVLFLMRWHDKLWFLEQRGYQELGIYIIIFSLFFEDFSYQHHMLRETYSIIQVLYLLCFLVRDIHPWFPSMWLTDMRFNTSLHHINIHTPHYIFSFWKNNIMCHSIFTHYDHYDFGVSNTIDSGQFRDIPRHIYKLRQMTW
jgi:hypothetical protein